MIKNKIKVINRQGLFYIVKNKNKLLKFKPWLGDIFSFLYDFIMKFSIFPNKFGSDLKKHYQILNNEFKNIHKMKVLELATGSGSTVNFLPNDNQYVGLDISIGLLKKAIKKFKNANFNNFQLYVASADDLPFSNNYFDIVICNLSLNFFDNVKSVFKEIKRVSVKNAQFICSVPIPERNTLKSKIRGTLYSENKLQVICKKYDFQYKKINLNNGILLYFKATLQ